MDMAKARLLQAACAVALLAAVPAFAQQTTTQPADTATSNSLNAPGAHDPTMPHASTSSMAPAERMGHPMHHSAMDGRASQSMHGRADTSQSSAVDQLNDRSYQAAQRGQAFSASDTVSRRMDGMGRSGSMNDMSGGSTSPAGAASGVGGGTGGGAAGNGAK
jgi:hypothetical protein